MLVLTRKQRQQITIGDNITITVLKVKGQAVRIGIEAPDGVRILRAELNATEEIADCEEPAVESSSQLTAQNGRRSRVGRESQAGSQCSKSNPTHGLPVDRAANRLQPVSLLSFR